MKKMYFNPSTQKSEGLFDSLIPTFRVYCGDPYVYGDKGSCVYYTIEADDEEQAKDKAMANKEFTDHIRMDNFDKRNLHVYKPAGTYVIGKVEYYDGDNKL